MRDNKKRDGEDASGNNTKAAEAGSNTTAERTSTRQTVTQGAGQHFKAEGVCPSRAFSLHTAGAARRPWRTFQGSSGGGGRPASLAPGPFACGSGLAGGEAKRTNVRT